MRPRARRPTATLRPLDRPTRVEMLRLAERGERHPDPAVAAVAYEWSHHPGWNRLANRLPGWLLPSTGAVVAVLFAILGLPLVLVLGAALVIVIGCLGWLSTSAARTVRSVYPDRPAPGAGNGAQAQPADGT